MNKADRNKPGRFVRSFQWESLDDVNACLQVARLEDLIESKLPLCIFRSLFFEATNIYLARKVGQ